MICIQTFIECFIKKLYACHEMFLDLLNTGPIAKNFTISTVNTAVTSYDYIESCQLVNMAIFSCITA